MPGADSKITPPRTPSLLSSTLLPLAAFVFEAPLVRGAERGSLSLPPQKETEAQEGADPLD